MNPAEERATASVSRGWWRLLLSSVPLLAPSSWMRRQSSTELQRRSAVIFEAISGIVPRSYSASPQLHLGSGAVDRPRRITHRERWESLNHLHGI